MHIRNSILAGDLLSLLENVSGSVRIIDIEIILQATKSDINLAITRLLSEDLIEIIKEDERIAIALTNRTKPLNNQNSGKKTAEQLVSVKTA